jgi:hypothetical protein
MSFERRIERRRNRSLRIGRLGVCLVLGAVVLIHPAVATPGIEIVSARYQDLDGDHDPFPDTGETGRVTFTVRNIGPALVGAEFLLTSTDPNVACIASPWVVVGNVAAGQVLTVGSLNPAEAGLTFRASNTLQTISVANPARIKLCLTATSYDSTSPSTTVCTNLAADLDLPPGTMEALALGPDGLPGTADDGLLSEGFDIDRDGNGVYSLADTFLPTTAPGIYDTSAPHGSYQRGTAAGPGAGDLGAVACGGFASPAEGNPVCILDPDYPLDWHFHCPPGATNCPNTDTPPCVSNTTGKTCSFNTPTGGTGNIKALSVPNSLHMGAHFDASSNLAGDTTHFRTIQGFVTPPINLALYIPNSGPSDMNLEMSFAHIERLMDNNGVNDGVFHGAVDYADVQVQRDEDSDPVVDQWGPWDKLVPFTSVYDHIPFAFSEFGSYYCEFTPSDTGTAPPNPHGAHETMCFHQGVWSHCGSVTQTNTTFPGDCAGPGLLDPSGFGVWVQSRFDLSSYVGQRIRIRWIATTWVFDDVYSSYYEVGSSWMSIPSDDGWWLDDVKVKGTLQSPVVSAAPDNDPAPAGSCAAGCDPSAGDHGTALVVQVTDADGTVLDGVSHVALAGQEVRIDAGGSSFPGGCPAGSAQYRFLRDGSVVQDWDGTSLFVDHPFYPTSYQVRMRCGSDLNCTSMVGWSLTLPVFSGDGGDVDLRVTYDLAAHTTRVSWNIPSSQALDLYRGRFGPGSGRGVLGPGPTWLLDTTGGTGSSPICLRSNISPTLAGSGFMNQVQDPDPPLGSFSYYLATRNTPAGPSLNALGCANPNVCFGGSAQGSACRTDADCPGGGICLSMALTTIPPPGNSCPPAGDPRRVVLQTIAAGVCP